MAKNVNICNCNYKRNYSIRNDDNNNREVKFNSFFKKVHLVNGVTILNASNEAKRCQACLIWDHKIMNSCLLLPRLTLFTKSKVPSFWSSTFMSIVINGDQTCVFGVADFNCSVIFDKDLCFSWYFEIGIISNIAQLRLCDQQNFHQTSLCDWLPYLSDNATSQKDINDRAHLTRGFYWRANNKRKTVSGVHLLSLSR